MRRLLGLLFCLLIIGSWIPVGADSLSPNILKTQEVSTIEKV